MMNTIRNFASHHLFKLVLLGLGVVIFGFAQQTFAAPIACRSVASVVKAVTDPDYHGVTTIIPA